MSASDHKHEWVREGPPEGWGCACGANLWTVQNSLHVPAADAESVAGDSYYTGFASRSESETLELWLANAPAELVQRLEAMHPGVYVIHNDAPRPRGVLDEIRDSFDWEARKGEGIEVTLGPGEDGYLQVGVEDDVEAAQKKLDAVYGPNVVRVHQAGRARPC